MHREWEKLIAIVQDGPPSLPEQPETTNVADTVVPHNVTPLERAPELEAKPDPVSVAADPFAASQ